MKKSHLNISGILLAGGKSSRMGREKGSISMGGKALFEYPLAVLEALCDEVLVSAGPGNEIKFQHPVVNDRVEGLGPLGGILSCLEHSSTPWNFILSYDMPLVSKGLVRHLMDLREEVELVIPGLDEHKPEPLCGLYHKDVIPAIRHMVAQKNYAVHQLIPRVCSRFVLIEPGMPFYQPELFLNINRQDDLEHFPAMDS
jgi:molybdopterin-guanine dinucleotide biosynthesis protein A